MSNDRPHGATPTALLITCWTVAVMVLATGVAHASQTVDSRTLRFGGTVVTNERVDVTGRVHLVTTIDGSARTGWMVHLAANLADTTGTGRSSGACYVAAGAGSGRVRIPPGPPSKAAFELGFDLFPTTRCQPDEIPPGPPSRATLRLSIGMSFNVSAAVSDATVSVATASAD